MTWIIDKDSPFTPLDNKRAGRHSPNATDEEIVIAKLTGRRFRLTDEDGKPLFYGWLTGPYTETVFIEIDALAPAAYEGQKIAGRVWPEAMFFEFQKRKTWSMPDYEEKADT